ncbi:metallopeptidase family protein [Micavibrio aeruginosavorus]|jgi:predicted Zn-dependent protease with MMP-like domain|uniref:Acetylglutamate kinase n=2 Tax=Micavibrio aeruginosavorus TaxID=349221 RepID=G2KQJ1_MICAA|nr:metallopeptidase family protein [Micavibrio aeruginosavorus]AEP09127.1 conserved hypothetical protein [Micavibrio aeruginosavorus ARL-13]AGH97530.1 Protein of unknown function DUF1025 [Micavibrio aeruginosavorus EPB]
MDRKQIIMSFSVPPSTEDLEVMAREVLDTVPEELVGFCEDMNVVVEEFPDSVVEQELELEDPYELLVLYRSGAEISPGVTKKSTDEEDTMIVYRRALLDLWCETGDDLGALLRQAIIEEIGQNFDFSEEEVEDMVGRHYQGML